MAILADRLQIDQLRALASAVAEQTFDAAAAALGVTPSAVSQRIKALETSVGRVLLERSKPVRPTASGRILLRLARDVDALLADAAEDLDPTAAGRPVTLPIAVNADSLATWLLPAVTPFAERATFTFHREDQGYSSELLREGVVMAAITATSTPVQGCSVRFLGHMRYRPAAAPSFHDRHFGGGVTATAMAAAPMIVFDSKDRLQHDFLATRWPSPTPNPPAHQVPASADFAAAIRVGLGWGMLPEAQLDADVAAGRLIVLDNRRHVDLPLYWQQWKLRSPLLEEVAAAVAEHARSALRQ